MESNEPTALRTIARTRASQRADLIEWLRRQVARLDATTAANIAIDRLAEQVIASTPEHASDQDVRWAAVRDATSLIEEDPAYDELAAQLLRQTYARELLGLEAGQPGYEARYRDVFVATVSRTIATGDLDVHMGTFDLPRLAAALQPERDNELRYIGAQTLRERYLLRVDERPVETFQGFLMRVAMGIALREDSRDARAIEFYELMSTLRFLPSTPTLFHAGLSHPQLSSCYVSKVEDDLAHIFKVMGDNAALSKWSGGIGNDWTAVRGTGAWIASTRVRSQGVVPFLKIANDVTIAINRSGRRRGATCAYLEVWHYDIEEFLDLRRNTGDDRRRTPDMNTAAWVPDLFMQRVEEKREWTLFSPDETPDLHECYGRAFAERYEAYERAADEGRIALFRRVDAAKLWRKMLTRLFETGHPWITFKDPCNVRSPQDHAGVIHNSNLCTEITLNNSDTETAVCNLGSINLARHIGSRNELDAASIEQTVATAIRVLDNVIDINYYPTEEAHRSNMEHRPIGLGMMGFQDLLFRLRVGFHEAEAEELADRTMELVSYHAILASSRLAEERGAYASFRGSKWDRGLLPHDTVELLERERGERINVPAGGALDWAPVRESIARHGMRNSNTMAIAPTATIANIAGVYPCIEPAYKNLYVKSNMSGEFTVINRYLVNELKARGLWDRQMRDELKFRDGSVERIERIPAEVRRRYLEAFEADPLTLLRLTARRAKWIDQSQSHNVFFRGSSGAELDRIYRAAWRMGVKTTYYLRTLAASQIEKSTLSAATWGYTQKRGPDIETLQAAVVKACSIDDPECEACQ